MINSTKISMGFGLCKCEQCRKRNDIEKIKQELMNIKELEDRLEGNELKKI